MTTSVPDIVPVLVYEDIEAAHDYLVEVLGFASAGMQRNPEGTVVHGEVTMGERRVWLHRVTHEHGLDSPRHLPLCHGGLSVHVPDVDAHFEASLAAGAVIEREPSDQPYGLREYAARDQEGHRFWFGTPIS